MEVKQKLKEFAQNEKIRFTFIFLILGVISYLWSFQSKVVETPAAIEDHKELDEMIPEGFALLPVELTNKEALTALIGETAFVDLYTLNPQNLSPHKKIAVRMKLIKSPKNPDQLAIIIQESRTLDILKYPGPYFATIQNRKNTKSEIVPTYSKSETTIQYSEEL